VRRDHRGDRGCVASRLDDDYVILGKLLCESLEKVTSHVDPPRSFELALVPGDRLGEGAVDIQSNYAHACSSISVRSKRELAGDTTSTDPRSRRIRESRKGRPCNELGLSATVYRRPARTFVLPAPRVPDGLTITPSPFGNRRTARRQRITYRIMGRSRE